MLARTDIQTDRQTDTVITVLRSTINGGLGGVIIQNVLLFE